MVFRIISVRKKISQFEETIKSLSAYIESIEGRLDGPDVSQEKREKLTFALTDIKKQIFDHKTSLVRLRKETTNIFIWNLVIAIGLLYPIYWLLYRFYDL